MSAVKRYTIICAALLVSLAGLVLSPAAAQAVTNDSWPTSLHDNARDGTSADTSVSASTAPDLTKLWSFPTGGPVASQPAIVNGVAYVGSWDGYEYALNASTGAVIWKTFLGITNGESDCKWRRSRG